MCITLELLQDGAGPLGGRLVGVAALLIVVLTCPFARGQSGCANVELVAVGGSVQARVVGGCENGQAPLSNPGTYSAVADCNGAIAQATITIPPAALGTMVFSGSATASNDGAPAATSSAFGTITIRAVGGGVRISAIRVGNVFGTPTFGPETLSEGGERQFDLSVGATILTSPDGGVVSNNGSLTITAEPVEAPQTSFGWGNPLGGAYSAPSNWNPECSAPPEHDGQRSDIAGFLLSSTVFIPVNGSGATAGRWAVGNDCRVEFGGDAGVFFASPTVPSLEIHSGGWLRLAPGATLNSVHTLLGSTGTTNPKLEIKGGNWTNSASTKVGNGVVDVIDGGTASSNSVSIGSGNGPGVLNLVGSGSTLHVAGEFVVGDTHDGTLNIDSGELTGSALITPFSIGQSAPGAVTVRGGDTGLNLDLEQSMVVGNGAGGRLSVEEGGKVRIAQDLVVNGFGSNPGGEVVVDGAGSDAVLLVNQVIVQANDLTEVVITNGGLLETEQLAIGSGQVRPGAAEVVVRGTIGAFGNAGLLVRDRQDFPGPVGLTQVGLSSPGVLTIQDGREARLEGGLNVGVGAQGIVQVSSLNVAPPFFTLLKVTGETQVGIDAPGIIQLDAGAVMESHGNMFIGLGGVNHSGVVTLNSNSLLFVDDALTVGTAGIGVLNNLTGSIVRCDTLLVGGTISGATGIITSRSDIIVAGNTQVGVGPGHGEILMAAPGSTLTLGGSMTIGNPVGGPGGGAVVLVDAFVQGTGNIVVNKNGSLSGTGTVAVPKVNAGGSISPGLSPGTLTIDGDYELRSTGSQIIEYAGLNLGEFDRLIVTGTAALGGRLEVHFRNGFSPDDPNAFIHSQDFIEADQGITGDYDQRIYAFPDIFADFDDDGDKDLLDVAAFQTCFGLSGSDLEPSCARANWEDNAEVNGVDLRELVTRITGPQ